MEVCNPMRSHSGSLKSVLMGIALLSASSWLAMSCGNDPINPSAPAPGPLSGNWQMSLQPSNPDLFTKNQSGFLVEDGTNLTGSMLFTDLQCTGTGNAAGTINGADVSLTVTPTGLEVNLTGTIASNPLSMSGTYTILATGCTGNAASPQSGTWTANPVTPLKGTYQGTLSSNKAGTTFSLTTQLTQGANGASSSAPLTGTVSATGYCFPTANVTGAVSGTSVVMNLVNSSGAQIGQINGTSSLNGTSMTGSFLISSLGKESPPCQSGDAGTFTVSQ
jgi:hypothetical protein